MTLLTTVIGRGTLAARPAAGDVPVGSIYYVTDDSTLYRSTGSTWESVEGASGATELDDLTDVDLSTPPSDGDVLTYVAGSSAWEPVAPSGGGGGATELDDLTDVDLSTPPSDGDVLTYVASSSAWEPVAPSGGGGGGMAQYFNLAALTPPDSGDYTWVNQGSATVTDEENGTKLSDVATASESWRLLVKAAPSTPYVIQALVIFDAAAANFQVGGLIWRDSASGKFVSAGFLYSSGYKVSVDKKDSPTAGNSNYTSATTTEERFIGYTWLRIADDGSNRTVSIAGPNRRYTQIHTVGHTDFITPDQVGFGVASINGTQAAKLTIAHWEES